MAVTYHAAVVMYCLCTGGLALALLAAIAWMLWKWR
jgi:hypothetical protein